MALSRAEINKRYRQRDPERVREQNKEYYQKCKVRLQRRKDAITEADLQKMVSTFERNEHRKIWLIRELYPDVWNIAWAMYYECGFRHTSTFGQGWLNKYAEFDLDHYKEKYIK